MSFEYDYDKPAFTFDKPAPIEQVDISNNVTFTLGYDVRNYSNLEKGKLYPQIQLRLDTAVMWKFFQSLGLPEVLAEKLYIRHYQELLERMETFQKSIYKRKALAAFKPFQPGEELVLYMVLARLFKLCPNAIEQNSFLLNRKDAIERHQKALVNINEKVSEAREFYRIKFDGDNLHEGNYNRQMYERKIRELGEDMVYYATKSPLLSKLTLGTGEYRLTLELR